MNDYDSDTSLDEDEMETTEYFGGLYVIWEGIYIIHINWFIYEKSVCSNDYKADKLLLDYHRKDFQENRFSELNETIKDINNIELSIIDSYLFEDEEKYDFIVEVLKERIEIYKKNNNNKICKTNDAYNMSALLDAINEIVLMDELFGDNSMEEEDKEMDDLTRLTRELFF